MNRHEQSPEAEVAWEADETAAAAAEAAAIGGHAVYPGVTPEQRPLVEAGEGVAEGFELAESDLVRDAEADPDRDLGRLVRGFPAETAPGSARLRDGEADHARSSETADW